MNNYAIIHPNSTYGNNIISVSLFLEFSFYTVDSFAVPKEEKEAYEHERNGRSNGDTFRKCGDDYDGADNQYNTYQINEQFHSGAAVKKFVTELNTVAFYVIKQSCGPFVVG